MSLTDMLVWDSSGMTYEEMVEKLRRRYGSRDQQEKFCVELRYRKRAQNESLQELAPDVERLVRLAYPEAGQSTRDIHGRDSFIDSLNNPGLEYKVCEKEPASLNSALTLAMKLEVLYKSREIQKESKTRYARRVQENNGKGDLAKMQQYENKREAPKHGYVNRSDKTGGSSSVYSRLDQQGREVRKLRERVQHLTEAKAMPADSRQYANTPAQVTAKEISELKEQIANQTN